MKKNGISLIVLVITIIIIIILAGAVILSLNNSNIISKAKLSKESNDFTSIREALEMEKSDVNLEQGTFTSTNATNIKIPAAYSSEIVVTEEGTIIIKGVAAGETSKITDIPNAVEKLGAVYIPYGFTVSTTAGEMSKENGLVIKDTSAGIANNEYVWVPVEGTINRTAFGGENLTTTYIEDVGTAYDTMKTQVEKYNGFYVSRYEAGTSTISEGSNLATDGTRKPLSQKNKYVWDNIPWGTSENVDTTNGAAKVAKLAYDGNTAVASSLLYGAQYDAMLNYINSTSTSIINGKTWGNYYSSTFTINAGAKYSIYYPYNTYTSISTATTKPADKNWLLTTGASEQNKAKNIYDIAGNVYEWTYERYSNSTRSRYTFGLFRQFWCSHPSYFTCELPLYKYGWWLGIPFRTLYKVALAII